MSESDLDPQNRRRGFLKQVVGATTALPFAGGATVTSLAGNALAQTPPAAPATPAKPAVNNVFGYVCFSQNEAAFVEQMVTVMCPADEYTPNGVDCGLAIYIDRQLAGDFGKGAKRYLRGPWAPGRPQQGYQLPMTPEQHF
ncbi:MAG: hypothetical protein Q7T55_23140, partial [Solirubrobacteraceae bacterium]|nr:hypothetical protein [Solirubrobacteraceae bacterium]